MDVKNIDLNPEFKIALDLMENSHKHMFITGRAGTGKSTLLDYFREKTKKNIVVLAPTGVAAVNVRGVTIHSFFGFKPDITPSKVQKGYKSKGRKGFYAKIEAIVIDEISMVRADLLDCVDTFLRLHGKRKGQSFGGIQMIFIGDLYQLPPVVTGEERSLFAGFYQTPYFFSSRAISDIDYELIELEKVYRQKDDVFIRLLNSVRNNSIDDRFLEILNSRFNPDFIPAENEFYIYLTTTNAKAYMVNCDRLAKLSGKLFSYKGEIDGEFDQKSLPAEKYLELKKDAQIMLVNNDREGRWVNGTVGKVVDIIKGDFSDVIMVELADGEIVEVNRHTWEMFKFTYNQTSNRLESKTIGTFTQYPIILAWAITIHKSQGKTFDKVIIDMDRGAFVHGQTYVALSRCVSLEGIVLKKEIKKNHILMDWKVVKYLTEFHYRKSESIMPLDAKINLINQAIKDKKKLKIVYLKASDVKSDREIVPDEVGKMEYLGKSFLGVSGYDLLRGEERVFRVDRILELSIIEK